MNDFESAIKEYNDGNLIVSTTPTSMTIETTSRCNLKCVMCPHAINAVDRPKHFNDDLVDKIKNYVLNTKSIQLHGIGEPLMSPSFWKILPLLPKECNSSINTNLTLLNDNYLEKIINSNLKLINVSLDAANGDTYNKIRGFNFDVVINNIKKIINARKENPLIHINMTLMRSNIEELKDFIQLAKDLKVDAVELWQLNKWPENEMNKYKINKDNWSFDYAKEGLWDYPSLSNKIIKESVKLAEDLEVKLLLQDSNNSIYFEESNE